MGHGLGRDQSLGFRARVGVYDRGRGVAQGFRARAGFRGWGEM